MVSQTDQDGLIPIENGRSDRAMDLETEKESGDRPQLSVVGANQYVRPVFDVRRASSELFM